jgi:hypothetical protein
MISTKQTSQTQSLSQRILDCHSCLKEYLYHQRPNWSDVNEIGDVVEVILDEWEERHHTREMSNNNTIVFTTTFKNPYSKSYIANKPKDFRSFFFF